MGLPLFLPLHGPAYLRTGCQLHLVLSAHFTVSSWLRKKDEATQRSEAAIAAVFLLQLCQDPCSTPNHTSATKACSNPGKGATLLVFHREGNRDVKVTWTCPKSTQLGSDKARVPIQLWVYVCVHACVHVWEYKSCDPDTKTCCLLCSTMFRCLMTT